MKSRLRICDRTGRDGRTNFCRTAVLDKKFENGIVLPTKLRSLSRMMDTGKGPRAGPITIRMSYSDYCYAWTIST